MSALWMTVLLTLFIQTAMSSTATPLPMVYNNSDGYNFTFPHLLPEFLGAPHKLMNMCLDMGLDGPPSSSMASNLQESNPIDMFFQSFLLFQGPPFNVSSSTNDTTDWNVTESLHNCSHMSCMIGLIKNSSDGPKCFMQAFMAPFAWMVLMANESETDPEDLRMILWVIRPFIRYMLPPVLVLPSHLSPPQLAGMAKVFSEEFAYLTPEQRNQIRIWLKEEIMKTLNCSTKPTKPASSPGSSDNKLKPKPKVHGQGHGEDSPPDGKGQRPVCLNWLNRTGMELMGSYLPGLPANEFQQIPKDELCAFFRGPQFKASFNRTVPQHLGRMLFQRLQKDCFTKHSEFLQHLSRLGSLACFFDKPKDLNSSQSTALLSQIKECANAASKQLKKKLLFNVLYSKDAQGPPSPEFLASLDSSASSILPASTFFNVKSSDVKKMGKGKWKKFQARILAKTFLKQGKKVSGIDLVELGSVVVGVPVKVLRKANFLELGKANLEKLCNKLTALQMAAVVDVMRSKMNESQLLNTISESQWSKLPRSILKRARFSSVDQLKGTNWTTGQSLEVVKMVMSGNLKADDIKKMKSAVQGVTCRMINNTNQSDVQGVSQALTGSKQWLSKTQANCAAEKLYFTLKNQRRDYFNSITDAELDAIPTLLLINMPEKAIMGLSDAVCSKFLDKMSQANFTSLALSSAARTILVKRALTCLGKNMSDLSSDDITRLGTLVCELGPLYLSNVGSDAQNATLSALAKCHQINGSHSSAIITLLKKVHGEPSDWSSSTMGSFGRILLLDDLEISSLTYKPWLQQTLWDVVESLPSGLSETAPKEFRILPNLSAVYKKLFELTTTSDPASSVARRKRAACAVTLDMIVNLGALNVNWPPDQLACISSEDFDNGVPILGEIDGYSIDQLDALKDKVLELWGPLGSLTEDQMSMLGCVARGFPSADLKELNITSVETLNVLRLCSWTQQQREAMWQAFAEANNLTASALGNVDIEGLDQFICGLNTTELGYLNNDVFREKVAKVGSFECPLSSVKVLKDKAVLLFGNPETWTEGDVYSMGNIIAGLSESEVQKLDVSVMSYIRQFTIQYMAPNLLAAMTVDQLQDLGPDNAASVTAAQRAMLSQDQLQALNKVLGVPISQSETTTQRPPAPAPTQEGNGASRVGMVGTLVFMQQFLFLALWYAA